MNRKRSLKIRKSKSKLRLFWLQKLKSLDKSMKLSTRRLLLESNSNSLKTTNSSNNLSSLNRTSINSNNRLNRISTNSNNNTSRMNLDSNPRPNSLCSHSSSPNSRTRLDFHHTHSNSPNSRMRLDSLRIHNKDLPQLRYIISISISVNLS